MAQYNQVLENALPLSVLFQQAQKPHIAGGDFRALQGVGRQGRGYDGSRAAPDVDSAELRVLEAAPVHQLARRGHDGLRASVGNRRKGGASRSERRGR